MTWAEFHNLNQGLQYKIDSYSYSAIYNFVKMKRHVLKSWGFGALLMGLTSVVLLKVEESACYSLPQLQSLSDLRLQPATFGLQVWLSKH